MLQDCVAVFDALVSERLPALHSHMTGEGLTVGMFCIGWFNTLFLIIDAMPHSTLLRIWDIFLFERSYKIVFRVALAILAVSETQLLAGGDLEGMMGHLNKFPGDVLNANKLLPVALGIKLTVKQLRKLEDALTLTTNSR